MYVSLFIYSRIIITTYVNAKLSVHVAGSGCVLVYQHCNMLCISGIVTGCQMQTVFEESKAGRPGVHLHGDTTACVV